jgi:putative ABC transport system permease protein
MDNLLRDLRHSIRLLVRQPGFAVTAILTLTLGIGATTAIFSVVNAIVLRPLPFGNPDRIMAVTRFLPRTGTRPANLSAPDFHDFHFQNQSFQALAYYAGGDSSVTVNGVADYANLQRVTADFFASLGVQARIGRLMSAEEHESDITIPAVVTDAFWRRRLGADPKAIGSTINLGLRSATVIGVLPPGVRFPAATDVYMPSWIFPETPTRGGHNYRVIGRLRDGISIEQAQDDMTAIARRLEKEYPTTNADKLVALLPLKDNLVGNTRQTLFVLLTAVAFVLLIACANVANLLLARATARGREMVVRASVGAGRWRLVQQLVTESLTLGIAAGVLGMVLAYYGVRALAALAPQDLPRADEIGVDRIALAFTLLISIVSSVIFGLAPALQVSRVRLVEGLRQGSKGSALGARTGWTRHAFVVAQVALAVVVVVAAGLLGRSLAALASVDLGFDAERLLVLRTTVPIAGLGDFPRAAAVYRDVLEQLRAQPGVSSLGAVTSLPTQVRSSGGYWVQGGPTREELGTRSPIAVLNVVTPGYLSTMRIPIRSGRDFDDGDRQGAPMVAIINEALARSSFPGQDPIGRWIQSGLDTPEPMVIVGVAGDVRTGGAAFPASPEIYMPNEQHMGPATAMNIVVRTSVANPITLVEPMRRLIQARDANVPVAALTMEGTLERASATPRFRTYLLTVFAVVALLLSAAGIYGVMAYTVSQRTAEIGVRVALGASRGSVLRAVVGQGVVFVGLGLALGVVLALAAGRLLQDLLFGVKPTDPLVLAGVVAVMAAVALLACVVPGRRALRVEPAMALRAE